MCIPIQNWHHGIQFSFLRRGCCCDYCNCIWCWTFSADHFHLPDLFLQTQKVKSLLSFFKLCDVRSFILNMFSVPLPQGWRDTFGQLFLIQLTAALRDGHQNHFRCEKSTVYIAITNKYVSCKRRYPKFSNPQGFTNHTVAMKHTFFCTPDTCQIKRLQLSDIEYLFIIQSAKRTVTWKGSGLIYNQKLYQRNIMQAVIYSSANKYFCIPL